MDALIAKSGRLDTRRNLQEPKKTSKNGEKVFISLSDKICDFQC